MSELDLWDKDGGVGREKLRDMESRCQTLGGQIVGISVLIFSESVIITVKCCQR